MIEVKLKVTIAVVFKVRSSKNGNAVGLTSILDRRYFFQFRKMLVLNVTVNSLVTVKPCSQRAN